MDWISVRDSVLGNKYGEPERNGKQGFVVETWTDGPNEDFPQADVLWADGTFSIVPFEELKRVDSDGRKSARTA